MGHEGFKEVEDIGKLQGYQALTNKLLRSSNKTLFDQVKVLHQEVDNLKDENNDMRVKIEHVFKMLNDRDETDAVQEINKQNLEVLAKRIDTNQRIMYHLLCKKCSWTI